MQNGIPQRRPEKLRRTMTKRDRSAGQVRDLSALRPVMLRCFPHMRRKCVFYCSDKSFRRRPAAIRHRLCGKRPRPPGNRLRFCVSDPDAEVYGCRVKLSASGSLFLRLRLFREPDASCTVCAFFRPRTAFCPLCGAPDDIFEYFSNFTFFLLKSLLRCYIMVRLKRLIKFLEVNQNMAVKVAINGFGRIGRLAFRQMFGAEGYEVVAINDLVDAKMLAHLLKYDSTQGRYALCDKVVAKENAIIVDGKEITIYAEKDANNLPWGKIGVDVVLECSGFYASKEKASAHINAGARKVVISAPAGNDLPTIVYSVNEKTLKPTDTVISAASCTTNCLAPMADTLNKLAPIEKGFMTTIHAYTGDQMLLDGPHRKGDLRRARAGALNIVPNSTGAAKAIGLVIPELAGKLDGAAQRVPTPTGSVTELVAVCNKTVTADEVNAAMKAAVSDSFGYTEDQIVSSDIIGITYGSLFDATQTKVTPLDGGKTLVKVVSWYDNENSYTSQMVRTIKYFSELK